MQANSKQRIILHVDANNFFASVETINNPEYKNIPVAVTGNAKKRTGIILAKNEIAKKYGVKTGEVIWEAKNKCPNLVCLEPHHELYEQYSKKLMSIYHRYTEKVEPFGIDECWLDITETQKFFGKPEEIALEIRNSVKKELGITVSVGVSFCKLFAKLASDMKKPDATTTITEKDLTTKIYPLPITEIIGIGKQLQKKFNLFNIYTLGQITEIPDTILQAKFGIIGLQIKNALLGNDKSEIISEEPTPKSVGNGTTTIVDIFKKEEIEKVVLYLAEIVSIRLKQKKLYASTISVSIKNTFLQYCHHSCSMNAPTNDKVNLYNNAMSVINKYWKYNEKIRAIRICASNLSSEYVKQLTIFDQIEKIPNAKIQNAVDIIRKKYGQHSIELAFLVNTKIINKNNIIQK